MDTASSFSNINDATFSDELVDQNIHDQTITFINETGSKIKDISEISDLLGNAWYKKVTTLVIPLSRLSDDFFTLSTGFAGEVLRKAGNYNMRLIVIGNSNPYCTQSKSFSSFVLEANKGEYVWFVDDIDSLQNKLANSKHL